MYYIGIDIAKFKHTVFIQDENGEVINKGIYFDNNNEGFNQLLTILNSLDKSQQKKIGLEATGHYHMNLIAFLQKHNYDVCEINPYFIAQYRKTHSLRKNKNDFIDSEIISNYLIEHKCQTYPREFYHIYSLKSLTRERESLVKQRSRQLIELTNILDIVFPEFKPFFDNKLTGTALYILKKYISPSKIANMTIDSYNNMKKELKRTISYAKFLKLKELAKNTVGFFDSLHELMLKTQLNLYLTLVETVESYDLKIKDEVLAINPKMLGIKWFSLNYIAIIIAGFNNFRTFDSYSKCLAFAGMESGRHQSGQVDYNQPMVKHGSGILRNALIYGTFTLLGRYPVLYEYYLKKRNEGKSHYVALTHTAKKLLRVIFLLETKNISFDSSLLK